MSQSIALKVYSLLSQVEKKHNFNLADGLHRQIFLAVMDGNDKGMRFTNQHIVDLNFTSRSSTYRKIADLKEWGFLSDMWDDTICYLKLGPSANDMLADAEKKLQVISAKTD